ncbi:MAG: HEAT repeat domain-containing protein [Verrucomicrobia bacterium]|nr:HEAT repeat domain-containing protein [Verrucomicrobiota bacterium]
MGEDLRQLADELRGDIDWEVRREAARRLAAFKTPEAVEALVEALDDLDDEVQQYAVKGLAQIGDPSAGAALLKPRVSRSDNPVTRWFAASALGRFGDPAVIEGLADALGDEEWIVRNEAAEALKLLVSEMARTETVETVRRLLRLLVVDNVEVREHVIQTLCRLERISVIPLVEALEMRSVALRSGICDVLGRIGNPSVAPALVEVIDDESPLVREPAIRSLGRLDVAGTIDAIVERLGDRDSRVVAAAVEALSRFGCRATPYLLNRLRHSRSRHMRTSIIAVLGKGRDSTAVLPLIDALSDSYFRVRRAAADALVEHGEAVMAQVSELLSLPRVAVGPLLECAVDEGNKRMRLRAIRSLGELKNPKTLDALRDLAGHPDDTIARTAEEALLRVQGATWARYYATHVLGRIRSPRGVRPLLSVLGDPSPIVRYGAVRALGRISSKDVAGALALVLVSDADAVVRAEAAKALAQVEIEDPVYTSMLLTGLQDEDPQVRVPVARMLGRLEDLRVVEPLVAALGDAHWKVCRNAENALVSMGSDAVPTLLELVGAGDGRRRLLLISVLSKIADPQVKAALEQMFEAKDTPADVRAAISQALQEIALAATQPDQAPGA